MGKQPTDVYKITGGILWEMEIVGEDNFVIQKEQDNNKNMEEIFATMKMAWIRLFVKTQVIKLYKID